MRARNPRLSTFLAATLLAATPAGWAAAADGPEPTATAPAAPFNAMGRDDAPVAIIEYSDLQCPYCARFALQTFPGIKRDYVDTGKVRYVVHDLPLPFHAFAVAAAVAVHCAGEQGKFWAYREALFARQSELGQSPYEALAVELKMDGARFHACRNDGAAEAAVRADAEHAGSMGITSTPSFLIGEPVEGGIHGEKFSGAEPYERFAKRIEAALEAVK
jgi:protein-disulfide isomerase